VQSSIDIRVPGKILLIGQRFLLFRYFLIIVLCVPTVSFHLVRLQQLLFHPKLKEKNNRFRKHRYLRSKKPTGLWKRLSAHNIQEFYGAHQALSTVLIHCNALVL
jgi:hypothetical protein